MIIVLDTLRNDFAIGLEELKKLGFAEYGQAISQASWTLPSHIAMFTGLNPSSHGVHESLGIYGVDLGNAARLALADPGTSLLEITKAMGYATYGASANPFVSPEFGFKFDYYSRFNHYGEVSPLEERFSGPNRLKNLWLLIRTRSLGVGIRIVLRKMRGRVSSFLRTEHLEKGASTMVRKFGDFEFKQPFLAFFNIMEAHGPYIWGENREEIFVSSVLGRPVDARYWRKVYPKHANLAITRAIELVASLARYDPLIIVCADHGQLLGERGRYDHGYFLDEELLKVPLYIRFPHGVPAPEASGPFFSITEIPKLILSVLRGERTAFGDLSAISESYGCQDNMAHYVSKDDKVNYSEIYSRRIRVFSRNGSFVYNERANRIEEASPNLSKEEIDSLIERIPPVVKEPPVTTNGAFSPAEEGLVHNRLKELGYE